MTCRFWSHEHGVYLSRCKRNRFTSEFSPRLQSWILGSRNVNELFSWLFRKARSLPMDGFFPLKFLMIMEWHGRSLLGTLIYMAEHHVTSSKFCPWFRPAPLILQNDNNLIMFHHPRQAMCVIFGEGPKFWDAPKRHESTACQHSFIVIHIFPLSFRDMDVTMCFNGRNVMLAGRTPKIG